MCTIRKANSEDLAAVLKLFDAAVTWLNSWGNTVQWVTTPVSSRPHLVSHIEEEIVCGWVGEAHELLGFIAFDRKIPGTFKASVDAETITGAQYVHSLVTARKPQARGIGRDLLRHAEQSVRASGHETLLLTCWADSPKLVGYYEAAGFNRCGVFEDDGNRREQHFHKAL